MTSADRLGPQWPKSEAPERWSRVRVRMKQAGFDGLLVADSDDFTRVEGGNVRFLSNIAVPLPFGEPITPIVVLPLEGDPALILPSSGWDCLPALLAKASWIEHIVSAPPVALLQKVAAMTTGLGAIRVTAELVASVLRKKGLAAGRIGLCGHYQGLEETRELLPQARVEPAKILDDSGRAHDLVEFERARTKTRYEIDCMERAHACIDAGIRAVQRAVVAGNSYAKAQSEIEHSIKMAGAEETLCTGSRGRGPVGTYAPPGWVQGTFEPGDMIAFELNARVGGYWAQLPRTWVVGRPTSAQRAQYEATQRSFEAMRDRIQVGVTGSELFETGNRVLQAAGFEPFARFGHGIGISLQEWFSVLIGDQGRIQEGQCILVHTAAINPRTGEESLYGEQFVIRDGRPHLLGGRTETLELASG